MPSNDLCTATAILRTMAAVDPQHPTVGQGSLMAASTGCSASCAGLTTKARHEIRHLYPKRSKACEALLGVGYHQSSVTDSMKR